MAGKRAFSRISGFGLCRRGFSVGLVLASLLTVVGAAHGEDAPASTDILDTLARTEKHPTFLKVVKAAELEGKLRELGPFTVFVPTEEAFAKLPKTTLDALLADRARLTAIVHLHIVPGKLSAEELEQQKTVKTHSAVSLTITPMTAGTPLKIDNASIVMKDMATTNGLVHTIDVVLMPK